LSSRLVSKNFKIKINRTIILHVVSYGCETLSPTLREEHRLKVLENRVLRRVFGPKREEVAGGWRTKVNGELHTLYILPIFIMVVKIEKDEMSGTCNTHGRSEKCLQYFGWKTCMEETTQKT
jgi:hypothetical protein